MPDHVLKEEPFQFGEGGRLFGVLTVPVMPPRNAQDLPVFVFLSAGVLHRVGPYRLYVRLARGLAQMGFSSLRVDLAGIGDSPRRSGFTNQQSVAADFAEILGVLELRLGRVPLVLAGLCSGADNAIRLAIAEARVVGMVLLDPICFPDHGLSGFRSRVIIEKYTDPTRYIGWLKRRFKALTRPPRKARSGTVCRPACDQGPSDPGTTAGVARDYRQTRRAGAVGFHGLRPRLLQSIGTTRPSLACETL